MDIYKPFRAALFCYELLRLLFLVFSFMFFTSLQTVVKGGFFPYLSYMSANALFPLISFFLFLQPGLYRSYLPLYMAGKTSAVVLFYTWAIFSLPPETGPLGKNSYIEGMIVLGGAFFISLGDAVSVFGTWLLNRKLLQADRQKPETNGGF